MHYIFQLFLVVLCISMFLVSRPMKFGLLLIAGICIYEYHVNLGIETFRDVTGSVTLLPLFFFTSELNSFNVLSKKCRYPILYAIFFLGVLYTLFSIYVSPHMGTGIKYFITSIVCRYLLPFYAFFCLEKKRDIFLVYKIAFLCVIVMTFFGGINLVSKHSVYVDWLFEGEAVGAYMENLGSKFTDADRFRVQATFSNPFDYGYTCISLLLFFLYGYSKKYITPKTMAVVAGCTLFGIISCNCRTVLLCFIIGLLLYFACSMKGSRYLTILVMLLPVLLVVFNIVPQLRDRFEFVSSMFEDDSHGITGSTMSMRAIQLASVMGYVMGHEFTGRGVGFFSKELGFSEGGVDQTLGGLEGSYLLTLLETGIIGTILYFSIIIVIMMWAWVKKNSHREPSSFLFALFSVFLIFGLLTGELRSAYITFLLAGISFHEILSPGSHKKRIDSVKK